MIIICNGKWKQSHVTRHGVGAKSIKANLIEFYPRKGLYQGYIKDLRRLCMDLNNIVSSINEAIGIGLTTDDVAEWLVLLMKEEGGYANHKNDSGGETFMGFTRKNNPNLSFWAIVDEAKATVQGDFHKNRKRIDSIVRPKLNKGHYLELCNASLKYLYPLTKVKSTTLNSTMAKTFLRGLFFFSFNAGPARVTNVIKNGVLDSGIVSRIVEHYNTIILSNSKNMVFHNGWSGRIARSFGLKSVNILTKEVIYD